MGIERKQNISNHLLRLFYINLYKINERYTVNKTCIFYIIENNTGANYSLKDNIKLPIFLDIPLFLPFLTLLPKSSYNPYEPFLLLKYSSSSVLHIYLSSRKGS